MTHTQRRNVRLALILIHAVVQLLMAWYVFHMLGGQYLENPGLHNEILIKVLIRLTAMFGVFAAYYSLMQLFSRRNQPSRR